MKRSISLSILTLSLLAATLIAPSAHAATVGGKCLIIGNKTTSGAKSLICKKLNGKNVWVLNTAKSTNSLGSFANPVLDGFSLVVNNIKYSVSSINADIGDALCAEDSGIDGCETDSNGNSTFSQNSTFGWLVLNLKVTNVTTSATTPNDFFTDFFVVGPGGKMITSTDLAPLTTPYDQAEEIAPKGFEVLQFAFKYPLGASNEYFNFALRHNKSSTLHEDYWFKSAKVDTATWLPALTQTTVAVVPDAQDVPLGSPNNQTPVDLKEVTIAIDVPLQGSSFDSNNSTIDAINLYLKQINYTVKNFHINVKVYDDSTAAAGSWDAAKCAENAQAHVANKDEVVVIGTYNSGCSKIQVPVLNQDPSGPLTMISQANTNPGLTTVWNPGEPDIYYPTGSRNFARVIESDQNQGIAAAQFAKSIGVRSVYVLNDTQSYGQGIAQAFITEAKKIGINILSPGATGEGWDAKQSDYTALFTKIAALNPDMVYVGGIFDNNGGQLVKDKVKVLGDNAKVKMIAPDGFTGYPEFMRMPEAQGAYLTFGGLEGVALPNPKNALTFQAAYKKAYGKEMIGSYPLYGVMALQVALQALAQSDGTRRGITNSIFSGSGISIDEGKSILGSAMHISTLSGDPSFRGTTIEIIRNNNEVTLQGWVTP